VRVEVGAARLTVLPRLREAAPTAPLLARGVGPRAARTTTRLPTEGCFRLREYEQGDDVRRIHWMRSLASRELIVRLPDEVPPDRPRVRLVLDTFFPEAFALTGDAPSELLDSMVAVWLAVGRALAESGARVTLVTALPREAAAAKVREDLALRALGPALRLGAQVAWQNRMRVEELLTDEPTFVVARAVVAPPPANVRWIVVLPTALGPEPPWPTSGGRFRYPMGSSENRWSQRRRVETRLALGRYDRRRLLGMGCNARPPGGFIAAPGPEGAIRLEAM
jgi:uncharacterized protein (DUF58 family)